ncbi:uncharacterized protein LOC143786032 [Ranitomeya variabilis]|uniref:uncharacterized protein LOC143786032 n=1 Tax=Ranitomeya variabilis TaxID=490064 RepID=UPI0040567218
MCDYFELGSMAEDEDRTAVEALIITLNILHDALDKKGWLLAEPGRDYGQRAEKAPLICLQLIEDLIQTLQQIELLKHHTTKSDIGAIGAVYPVPGAPVVGLCQEFWLRHEDLRPCSRPGSLITAAAHILGYDDERWIMARMEEDQRPVLTGRLICDAFEFWMRHKGNYVNGSYTCCGETSVCSVCEDSDMRFFLHSEMDEEQRTVAETSRKATLNVLTDVHRKGLVVDNSHLLQPTVSFPLMSRTLLGNLVETLRTVTFKCDKKPRNKILFAYPAPQDVVYLCPLFWKQKPRLGHGSQIGTLILCVAQMLGYRHILDGTSDAEEPMGVQKGTLLTADDICAVFETWMNHQKPYVEGSYSCCGEKVQDSVCTESFMGLQLRESLREVDDNEEDND